MKQDPDIIGYRAIRSRATGEIVTPLAPMYAEDWPYQNVSPDQPLVRYMDSWKFEDLFKTQELYFRRADKFDDPLEGTLSKKGVHGTSRSDVAFAKAAKLEGDAYEKACDYRSTVKSCTFINCWHINTAESQKMWDAYTTSSDSLLVITTASRLKQALKDPVIGAGVRYVETDSPRTEFDERSLFFYKDISYAFEQEFRLLIDLMMLGEAIRSDHPDDFYRRVPVDLSTLVYGIQLHPQATQETKDKIGILVKRHLPNTTESRTNDNGRGKH
jgi:hypothetical protein